MNRHVICTSVVASLAACLLFASAAKAAESSEKHFPITTFGTLTLHVPAAWQDLSVVGETGARVPSMIEFMGRDAAGSVQLKLLPLVPPVLKAEMKSDAGLEKLCTAMASRFVAGSAEKKVTLVNLDGPEVHGFYYTLTDPSPDAGEFKCTSGGAFRIGETVLTMTLMHQPKQPGFDAAIEAVKLATLAGATTRPTSQLTTRSPTKTLSLLAPDGKWRVALSDPGCGPARGSRRGAQARYEA